MLGANVIVNNKEEAGITEPLRKFASRSPKLSRVSGSKTKVRITFQCITDRDAFLDAAKEVNVTPTFFSMN